MESTEVAAVSLTWIGAVLFVWGVTMGFHVLGLGTRWRNISMRYYDRNTDARGYERNTRIFRIGYRAIAVLGLLLLIPGL